MFMDFCKPHSDMAEMSVCEYTQLSDLRVLGHLSNQGPFPRATLSSQSPGSGYVSSLHCKIMQSQTSVRVYGGVKRISCRLKCMASFIPGSETHRQLIHPHSIVFTLT